MRRSDMASPMYGHIIRMCRSNRSGSRWRNAASPSSPRRRPINPARAIRGLRLLTMGRRSSTPFIPATRQTIPTFAFRISLSTANIRRAKIWERIFPLRHCAERQQTGVSALSPRDFMERRPIAAIARP